ncbi:DUF29 family protein, partial [Cylindrospermopsis raciborskii UAM/DH-MRr]|uniref:DUF29 family protein n=1 Tax=Cylindrospermopsis raciborskii TaxID=77022 RepID=UPI0038797609
QYQPLLRGSSWQATIRTQRDRIRCRLQKTPSLKTCLQDPEWWLDAWVDAKDAASQQTSIAYDQLPEQFPWDGDRILTENWFPELEEGEQYY